MGLFDKIKAFAENGGLDRLTETVGKTVNSLMNERQESSAASAAAAHAERSVNDNAASDKAEKILGSGNVPPKPYFTVNEEYGDKKYSFELSRDFIEFNSHSEASPSFQYEPFSDEDFTEYDGELPVLCICVNNKIYDASESFEASGKAEGLDVVPCSHPCFLYSTSFTEYGKKYYAYGFASGTARETEMLFAAYSPKLSGTALEKKLIAAVDHAVQTYSESEL